MIAVGRALAEALVEAHAAGRVVIPHLLATQLHPDGSITFGDGDPSLSPRRRGEAPSTAADVYAAAALWLEAATGRHLPPGVEPGDVIPFVRHQAPDLPPSALAPIFTAVHPAPDARPTAAAWLAQWRACEAAERDRPHAAVDEVSVGFDSHVGKVKLLLTQTNQDSLYVGARGHDRMLVLCDGISVSDAGRGDIASKTATQAIGRLWEHLPPKLIATDRLIDRALTLANQAICEKALKAANGDLTGRLPMGTTVVLARLLGNRAHLAWLGDSRAYLIGPWGVSLLTADDNVSGERFRAWADGLARSWHPDGHALVRYLGHFDESIQPAAFPAHQVELTLAPGERLMLCSDGITDYLGSHESIVAAHVAERVGPDVDPGEACRALVSLANRLGGGDNASVVIAAADAVGDPWDADEE